MPLEESQVMRVLETVDDPEIGVDVVALGLVYRVAIDGGRVLVEMTMTSPACPLGDEIAVEAERAVRTLEGVDDVEVRLVFEPPWTPERMSPAAKRELGWAA